MTTTMQRTLKKVIRRWRTTPAYRAKSHSERCVLASLYRNGYLQRRTWHGVDGKPGASYEYAPSLAVGLSSGALYGTGVRP